MNKNTTKKVMLLTVALLTLSTNICAMSEQEITCNQTIQNKDKYTLDDISKRLHFLFNEYIKYGEWTITIDDFTDELSAKGHSKLAKALLELANAVIKKQKQTGKQMSQLEMKSTMAPILINKVGVMPAMKIRSMMEKLEVELNTKAEKNGLHFETVLQNLLQNRSIDHSEDVDIVSIKTDKDGNHIVTEYMEHIEYDADGNVIEDETSVVVHK